MKFSLPVHLAPALAGAFFCVLLAGCASPQVAQLREQPLPASLAARAQLPDVPFFAQTEHACGPAALAMVLHSAGVAVRPETLVDAVYLPGRKGSLAVELVAAARQRGLMVHTVPPRIAALLQEVAAGNPVLVLQNLSLPVYPVWHYAVAIGYDLERNTLTLHSGETAALEMSLYAFERTWARGDYWAMVALPPDRLPASADAMAVARSAAALEASHPHAARSAYRTALQRWPEDARLFLGLGNSAYALQDLPEAIRAYQAAVQQRPDFADAWNNLAQAQWDHGDAQAASAAIARAVALGGVRRADYQALQHQIASGTRTSPP